MENLKKIIMENEYIMFIFPIAIVLLFFGVGFLLLGALKVLFIFFNRNSSVK